MKPILMFTLEACPHCKRALALVEEVKRENSTYASLEIEIIDETKHPDIASQYDYYYVPTYFVDGLKIHEGVPSKDKIRAVLDAALE